MIAFVNMSSLGTLNEITESDHLKAQFLLWMENAGFGASKKANDVFILLN